MVEMRSGEDRRINKDRRKKDISSYSGPENRGAKQQRIIKDRRNIDNNSIVKRTLSPHNEGRRSGIDQREFSYTGVMPERRSGKDRRSFV
jgi:hypothetical protein